MSERSEMRLPRALSLLVFPLLLSDPSFLHSQTPDPPPPETAIKVDVELVTLDVSVTDEHYRAASGLRAENFEVYEDKVRQEIASVSEVDNTVSVGLVFDRSGSVGGNIELCKQAVRAFFQYANPEDEYFLIEFNDRPILLSDFTSRRDIILNHVGAARATGRTAFYDAIYFAIAQMQNARNKRKVLLIFSDGGENSSQYSERDVRDALRQMESDVQIYTLGVFEPPNFRRTREEMEGPGTMRRLAEISNGKAFEVDSPTRLAEATGQISRELRTEYEIAYYPSNRVHNGRWRNVVLKVKPPRGAPILDARTRPGYYAPAH